LSGLRSWGDQTPWAKTGPSPKRYMREGFNEQRISQVWIVALVDEELVYEKRTGDCHVEQISKDRNREDEGGGAQSTKGKILKTGGRGFRVTIGTQSEAEEVTYYVQGG